MKVYTVYDNTDGGYSIWYEYFDVASRKYVKKSYYAYNKKAMTEFSKKLEANNYKFVGKI
jgi:hypothetical protein